MYFSHKNSYIAVMLALSLLSASAYAKQEMEELLPVELKPIAPQPQSILQETELLPVNPIRSIPQTLELQPLTPVRVTPLKPASQPNAVEVKPLTTKTPTAEVHAQPLTPVRVIPIAKPEPVVQEKQAPAKNTKPTVSPVVPQKTLANQKQQPISPKTKTSTPSAEMVAENPAPTQRQGIFSQALARAKSLLKKSSETEQTAEELTPVAAHSGSLKDAPSNPPAQSVAAMNQLRNRQTQALQTNPSTGKLKTAENTSTPSSPKDASNTPPEPSVTAMTALRARQTWQQALQADNTKGNLKTAENIATPSKQKDSASTTTAPAQSVAALNQLRARQTQNANTGNLKTAENTSTPSNLKTPVRQDAIAQSKENTVTDSEKPKVVKASDFTTALPHSADGPAKVLALDSSVQATRGRHYGINALQSILQKSLIDDPAVLEAWANEQAAQSTADGSFALHYPTVTVSGNQPLSTDYDNPNNEKDKRFNPAVQSTLNLWSWGAINNQAKRDKAKERYFYYKYYETREELGNTIGMEYLNALYYRDALKVLEDSLERHKKIMHDLDIIVANDPGRRSEWVQGRAREVQTRQTIATYQTQLETSLSRLEKYTGRAMKAEHLQDPFPVGDMARILSHRRADDVLHPTYMAQNAELQSAEANLKSSKGRLLPALNLVASADRDSKQVYLTASWDILNRSTNYEVAATAQEVVAAKSRLDQVSRDISERSRTAKQQMEQSRERIKISMEQVESNREVVRMYELQFKIARQTLITLLDAYSDLSSVELAVVSSHNDFRAAALSYLHAQHGIAAWADVPIDEKRDKRYYQETTVTESKK
ncbi:MAG: TolC family protein [Neisseriaceae bacterium]|nr:TolC family protein [Neisseriaceae bacterium]